MNNIKQIDIKNRTYYFFDDANMKNLDPNKIKIEEKSHKNILIYYIGYVTIKDLCYVKINSVNPLYLLIDKINGYIGESNGNKYLTLVPTDESKDILKKYEELWTKIGDQIRKITNNSDSYGEKHMKIKFNSDDDLPLHKTLELYNMVIIARSVFHEDSKYYPQGFLDECLYKLGQK